MTLLHTSFYRIILLLKKLAPQLHNLIVNLHTNNRQVKKQHFSSKQTTIINFLYLQQFNIKHNTTKMQLIYYKYKAKSFLMCCSPHKPTKVITMSSIHSDDDHVQSIESQIDLISKPRSHFAKTHAIFPSHMMTMLIGFKNFSFPMLFTPSPTLDSCMHDTQHRSKANKINR